MNLCCFPVSYTHLDVYKRQEYYLINNWRYAPCPYRHHCLADSRPARRVESSQVCSFTVSTRQGMGEPKVYIIIVRIGLVALIMSGLSMWLMWATCYLHQMYPLIEPKL